jgi:PST family polysaccharide transporter
LPRAEPTYRAYGRREMNAYWIKYLPGFVRTRLDGRHGLQAVLGNSGWLFADRILRMGVGLFVGVWIARYLGPEQFGLWNYAIAFTALFGAFATLGLDNIVVRELVKTPARQNELLGSAFALKLIGGTIALLITLLAISLVRSGETLTLWLVGISAAGFVFQSVNVIGFYFQSEVQSRYTVYAANGAFILMTMVKIALLLSAAPLIAFAWAGLGEVILTAYFLTLVYRANHHRMREWRYEGSVARELMSNSWPLILSSISIMIYMRIDQIMIGQMLGDKEVGLFSAAVKVSEIWYFVPIAIVSSVFPAVIESKQQSTSLYRARLQTLFTMMAWLGIGVAIFMTFASEFIVTSLFGRAYIPSATVLVIHVWSGVFVALGVASGSCLTVENLQKYSFFRTLNGGIANVVLNLIFIPRYGINAAAAATVVSYAFSVFSVGFLKNGRFVFWMMLKAFSPLNFKKGFY